MLEPVPDPRRIQAKAMYLRMDMPRLTDIARRLGVSRNDIADWKNEENWLQQRDEFRSKVAALLIDKAGTPAETAAQTLRLCNEIEKLVHRELQDIPMVPKLERLTHILTKVHGLRSDIWKQFGINVQTADSSKPE